MFFPKEVEKVVDVNVTACVDVRCHYLTVCLCVLKIFQYVDCCPLRPYQALTTCL